MHLECWESLPDSQLHPCSHVQVTVLFIIPSSEKGSRAGLCSGCCTPCKGSSPWPPSHGAHVQFLLPCQNIMLLVPLIFYRSYVLSWSFMGIINVNLFELHNINQSAAPVQAAGLTSVPLLGFGSIHPPCEMPRNDSPRCFSCAAGQDAGVVLLGAQ